MVIKCAFTGAQGVGKDTTIAGVWHELKMRGYDVDVVNEMAKDAWYRGFKLGKDTTIASQLYMLGKQLMVESYHAKSPADFILYNRSMLDCIIVSRTVLSEKEAKPLEYAILELLKINKYDIIFQMEKFQDKVPDDKVRDSNPESVERFRKAFTEFGEQLKSFGQNVYTINARKDSIAKICDVLEAQLLAK